MKTYIVKFKQAAAITGIALSGVASSGAMTPANALLFNFTSAAGTSQDAINGFAAAGARWSSKFTDPVTVNINIGFTDLGTSILAQASSERQIYDYSRFYTALSNDRTSADDRTAVASLPNGSAAGSTFSMLLNRTANNPNGSGSATPYLDNNGNANNSKVNISNANAKALGLLMDSPGQAILNLEQVAGFGTSNATLGSGIISDVALAPANASVGSDASISFNSTFAFDFNPNDGIDSGSIDFVGVATHEIGHALGFTSGVDVLDFNSPPNGVFTDDQFTFVNSLDLFRYSAASTAAGAIDWTADARDKYLSFDRGATSIGALATGTRFGDKQQASHWKDSPNDRLITELGIMNPTFSRGQLGVITENDLRAFDVIGWNRADVAATEVPEPSNVIGSLMFAGFGAKMVLKRRKKLSELNVKSV